MNKTQKTEYLELAKNILFNNQMSILIEYKGLTSGEMTELRMLLKDNGANLKIIKNNLSIKAIEDTGYSFLKDYLKDQIAISYCDDPLALSSLLVKYAKDNEKVKIKIGSLNGEAVGLDKIVELSKLGSVNDVRARFIGVLNAPASKLVRVFDAFAKKDA